MSRTTRKAEREATRSQQAPTSRRYLTHCTASRSLEQTRRGRSQDTRRAAALQPDRATVARLFTTSGRSHPHPARDAQPHDKKS